MAWNIKVSVLCLSLCLLEIISPSPLLNCNLPIHQGAQTFAGHQTNVKLKIVNS